MANFKIEGLPPMIINITAFEIVLNLDFFIISSFPLINLL